MLMVTTAQMTLHPTVVSFHVVVLKYCAPLKQIFLGVWKRNSAQLDHVNLITQISSAQKAQIALPFANQMKLNAQ